MRNIVPIITASIFAAAGTTAWAEHAPAEPAKAETSAAPTTLDKSAETTKPDAQTIVVKPRESGVNQPLCTGE